MTAGQPFRRQPNTAHGSMTLHGFDRVMRAARFEATSRPEPGRDERLIDPDRGYQQPAHEPAHAAPSCARDWTAARARRESSSAAASCPSRAAAERPITTQSSPAPSDPWRTRNHSRIRRLTRLRTTARPTFRLTVIPRRLPGVSAGAAPRSQTSTTKAVLAARRPRRVTCSNSTERRSRSVCRKQPVCGDMTTSTGSRLRSACGLWLAVV